MDKIHPKYHRYQGRPDIQDIIKADYSIVLPVFRQGVKLQ